MQAENSRILINCDNKQISVEFEDSCLRIRMHARYGTVLFVHYT